MIVRLTGRLLEKHPDHVVVEVQGVGYHVWITLNTYEVLPDPGQEVTLLIYHQVREDSQDLFGFCQYRGAGGFQASHHHQRDRGEDGRHHPEWRSAR
ncbi:unnamed protein product [marine sediment metagenome]|uniref:DNA helicase Holliday junction RuvA type domain-containing protein n=1 Tax=marine sediment metagenome TaxID=412755 RepID=X1GMP5_9ZZZZ